MEYHIIDMNNIIQNAYVILYFEYIILYQSNIILNTSVSIPITLFFKFEISIILTFYFVIIHSTFLTSFNFTFLYLHQFIHFKIPDCFFIINII
jgi:hypothetical protein